jgi:hypothetical protein
MKVAHKPVIRGTSNESKMLHEKKTAFVRGKVNKVEERL